MELEYEDNSRRRKILIVVGVVLALVAGGAAFFLITQAQNQGPGQVTTRQVVVAARDIPAKTVLAASDLTLLPLPDGPALAQAITDPAQAVGRVTAVAIFAQQPLSPNLLASTTAGSQFSILGPTETIAPDSPDWRAVAVNVPDERAVAGQIQAGQLVDIFVTVQVNVTVPVPGQAPPGATPAPQQTPGDFYTDKSTKLTYQAVPVLARQGTLYILKVRTHDAEEINHLLAAGNASFSFALRAEGDARVIDPADYGETTNKIIEEKGLPIPEVYPK